MNEESNAEMRKFTISTLSHPRRTNLYIHDDIKIIQSLLPRQAVYILTR
jgi:hypothetical protein